MIVTLPASFSSNLDLQCSLAWTLAPTDAERLGDPVIVSFEPVTYSVTADAGGVTLEHGISNWEFGVSERKTFGPNDVTIGTELDPKWEDAEIHAYIGDTVTFSYEAVSRVATQDGLAPSWFRAAWGSSLIELGFRVRAFPAIVAPDVVEKTHLEAEDAFAEAGFIAGLDIPTCSDTVPVGSVVAQQPPAETWVPYSMQLATLYLSGALVPNLIGMAEENVVLPLIDANLIQGRVTYRYEGPAVPLGIVVAQSPGPAIFVPCGTAVDLVVSGESNGGDDDGDDDDGDNGGGGIPIQFDIKPNDCENRITVPWNAADKIRIPAAVIGWPDFDVRTIVTNSLLLEIWTYVPAVG
jgi:hypothetical protein